MVPRPEEQSNNRSNHKLYYFSLKIVLVMKWSNKVEKAEMKWSATIVAKREIDLSPWLTVVASG